MMLSVFMSAMSLLAWLWRGILWCRRLSWSTMVKNTRRTRWHDTSTVWLPAVSSWRRGTLVTSDDMTSTEVTSGCLLTMLCFCGVCVPLDGKILLAMNFNTKLTKEFIIVLAPILSPPILSPAHIIHHRHPTFPFLCSVACCPMLPPSAFIPPPYHTFSSVQRHLPLSTIRSNLISSYRQNGARFVLRRLHSENTIGWKMHRHIARPLTDFIRRPILNSFCLQQSHLSGVGGSAANGSLKNGGCRY